jgi:hypothetical protein
MIWAQCLIVLFEGFFLFCDATGMNQGLTCPECGESLCCPRQHGSYGYDPTVPVIWRLAYIFILACAGTFTKLFS